MDIAHDLYEEIPRLCEVILKITRIVVDVLYLAPAGVRELVHGGLVITGNNKLLYVGRT